MAKEKDETPEQRDERIRGSMRAEANAMAHDVSPSAGEELAEGSDARKAKQQEAKGKK